MDASDYFSNAFFSGTTDSEYTIINTPQESNTYTFLLKDNLVTGTYKMEFILYDGNSRYGSVEKYIIIK